MPRNRRLAIILALLTVASGSGVVLWHRVPAGTIPYHGHAIPKEQLRVVDPHPGCEEEHYHALASKSATATDGTALPDETDCGYGPVH